MSRQELLFNHILKEYSIHKDLHITRNIHLCCADENFKVMLQCVRDLKLTKYNILQPFEETRHKLHKSSCFDFSFRFDVLLFDFLLT